MGGLVEMEFQDNVEQIAEEAEFFLWKGCKV